MENQPLTLEEMHEALATLLKMVDGGYLNPVMNESFRDVAFQLQNEIDLAVRGEWID